MLKEYFIRQVENKLNRTLTEEEKNKLISDMRLTLAAVQDMISKKLDAYIDGK